MVKQIDVNEFLDLTVEELFADRFARYSKYIIQDRALPDIRDGLKPVQRRIIYSMNKEGNTFSKQFRKSAKTVGNVIGNYHPHGDTSVYDAMVRMSQDWKVNAPLIIMHGNNGSIDGDRAAAMRYTETKMSQYSEYMIKDIDENTVQQIPNFDDTELEPTVLPTRIPNLLINGVSGISAGYATDIPPHNANEIVQGCIYLNQHPEATLDELMKIIPGPDLPTGGIIQGTDGIRQAYETGKGKIIIKSETKIVANEIIVTAIPYEVNKSTLLQKIDLIRIDKKIDGIKEIIDQSDQKGMKIVISCQKGANVEMILRYLLKNTQLQRSYSLNMIAINKKRPEQLGLIAILDAFIKHREDVILRRSNFRLEKANKKLHILSGMITAVSMLDEVVEIIRNSSDKNDSKINLIKQFRFTQEQAEAVVMMQLYRLSNTDIHNLESNVVALNEEINILNKILSKKEVLTNLITTELQEVYDLATYERKTKIEKDVEELVIDQKDLLKAEKMIVAVTKKGYIKRSNPRSYMSSQELSTCQVGDIVVGNISTNTRNNILVFFNDGTYVNIPVHMIVENKWKDVGVHISSFCKINDGVNVIGVVQTADFKDYTDIISISKLGYYTKSKFVELSNHKICQKIQWIKIKKAAEIVSFDFANGNNLEQLLSDDVMFITNQGRYVKYERNNLQEFGLKRVGVKLINLHKDEVFKFVIYLNNDFMITTSNVSYVAFNHKNIASTEKPKILYTNNKTKPLEVFNLVKLNTNNILIKEVITEHLIDMKKIKLTTTEGKFKSLVNVNELISIENLLDIK